MRARAIWTQEFWAGAAFVALGVAAVAIARSYDMGTTKNMGPGYFPTLLGAALILLGAASCARAVITGRGDAIGPLPLRAVLLVTASAACFAFLVDQAGLAVTVFACAFLACLAGRQFRPAEALAIAVILTGFTSILFVHWLGLPVSIAPEGW